MPTLAQQGIRGRVNVVRDVNVVCPCTMIREPLIVLQGQRVAAMGALQQWHTRSFSIRTHRVAGEYSAACHPQNMM